MKKPPEESDSACTFHMTYSLDECARTTISHTFLSKKKMVYNIFDHLDWIGIHPGVISVTDVHNPNTARRRLHVVV